MTIALATLLAIGLITLLLRQSPSSQITPVTSTTSTSIVPISTTYFGTTSTTCASTSTAVAGLGTIACPSYSRPIWDGPPTMVIPSTPGPQTLEAADVFTGTGPPAKKGDRLLVRYELGTYSSHRIVQSSWVDQYFPFYIYYLGQDQVVPGWDRGLVGMRAGGIRELIIPPSLGYGALSPGPGISKNDTLVYIIDIYKIN